jgi:hypothetical protein
VKRWELQRGLPIHRPPGGAKTAVFADVGLKGSRGGPDLAEPLEPEPSAVVAPADAEPVAPSRRPIRLIAALGGLVLLAIAALVAYPAFRTETLPHQPSAEAAQLYQAGLYHWNMRTAAGLNAALGEFRQAIALDSGYAASACRPRQCL